MIYNVYCLLCCDEKFMKEEKICDFVDGLVYVWKEFGC